MALEDFKQGNHDGIGNTDQDTSTLQTVDGAVDAAKTIAALNIINTVEDADGPDEIVDSIVEGTYWPTQREWDDMKNEAGVTTWHANMEDRIGITANEVYLKAGANPWDFQPMDTEFKYKVYADMYLAAFIYGESFTQQQFSDDKRFTSGVTIKDTLDLTFNELKGLLNLERNDMEVSEDEIISELDDLVDKHGYPISEPKIDLYCSFSFEAVARRFGDDTGLLSSLTELGYEVTNTQKSKSKRAKHNYTRRSEAREMIEGLDGHDPSADGYIYLLKCKREKDGNIHWYVGSVGTRRDFEDRLTEHMREDGDFKGLDVDGIRRHGVDYEIQVESVHSIHREDVSVDMRDYLDTLEWRKFSEYTGELDEPVLGI